MKRIVLTAVFLFSISTVALAQVQVTLSSKGFGVEEEIHAKVVNGRANPITFCVEYGQWSPKNGELESTPSPFVVQRYSASKWSTLLIGPDVGSSRHSLELQAGKSEEFTFRLNNVGKIRLLLYYWRGSVSESACSVPEKGAKRIFSETFTVK
jgi:hypothetical protein